MRISSLYIALVMIITLTIIFIGLSYKLIISWDYLQFWWVLLLPILSKVLFPYSRFTKFINKRLFTKYMK